MTRAEELAANGRMVASPWARTWAVLVVCPVVTPKFIAGTLMQPLDEVELALDFLISCGYVMRTNDLVQLTTSGQAEFLHRMGGGS